MGTKRSNTKPRMTFHIQPTMMSHLHSARLQYLYTVGFSFPVFHPLPVALGQGFAASFAVVGSSHLLILLFSLLPLFLNALLLKGV